MNEIDEIWNHLEHIIQYQRIVSLVKTQKGRAITLDVKISQVARSRCEIIVVARQDQDISHLLDAQVLLYSDLFPKPIQATVASVDVYNRLVILTDLLYPVSMRECRREARIQPNERLQVRIAYRAQNECQAFVSDLSVEGVSLIVNAGTIDFEKVFVPKDSVRLHLSLQTSMQTDREFSFPATVSYINPIGNSQYFRVGFITLPSEQDKSILRRYIIDWQTQLYNEI